MILQPYLLQVCIGILTSARRSQTPRMFNICNDHCILYLSYFNTFSIINIFVLLFENERVYEALSPQTQAFTYLQLSGPCTSIETPVRTTSPAPPDRPTAATQGLRSRVCDKKHGIRLLVIAVGLVFIGILVGASHKMWSPQNEV